MSAHPEFVPSLVDRIKQTLVALKMPRAIEILDVTVRRLERGEMTALEAIDALLAEELTLRENRRARLSGVLNPRRQATKFLARKVRPHRNRSPHGKRPSVCHLESCCG
jgi:hypothetical protein